MPPRRKSKRTTQTDGDVDGDNASQGDDHHSPPTSSGPAASNTISLGPAILDVDLPALASLLPGKTLEKPSAEVIIQCYKMILTLHEEAETRSREVEDLQAEVEKKDVELDQALQDRETAIKELESTVEVTQKELQETKEEKEKLAASHAVLQAQVSQMSSVNTSSSHELDAFKRKIEELEREKRDVMVLVSRLEEDSTQRDEEVKRLRENLKTSRLDNQELESTVRHARSSERSLEFKVETLTHQLKLSQDESERTNVELSKKIEEYSIYRRDKHTEIVQLQSELDSLKQDHNQTLSTLRTLQSSHNSQTQQLSHALQKVQDLTGQLADQDAKYSSEAANLRRLVQMMEDREAQSKQLVESIERDWDGLSAKAAARERKLREELEEEQQKVVALKTELDETKAVVDRISRGELPLPPVERAPPAGSLSSMSPGLALLSRVQKSGKTFTEVYSNYIRMESELAQKTAEVDRLDRTLAEVIGELEERAPALAQQKSETERFRLENAQLASQLREAISDRDAMSAHMQESNQKYKRSQQENALLNQQLEDLGRQIKALLKELGRRQDATLPSDEDMQSINPADNIEAVITNNLVLYRSIDQLQEQNQRLLKITRDLGARMEKEERDYKDRLELEQNEAIREAHDAIQELQSQLEQTQRSHQATVQAYNKEREALKLMIQRYERGAMASLPQMNGRPLEHPELERELEEIQSSFEAYRHEMGIDAAKLREEAAAYQREANQLRAALVKANAKIEFLSEQQRLQQDQYAVQERENRSLSQRTQQLSDQSTRFEVECHRVVEQLQNANSQVDRLRTECSNLRAEKKLWDDVRNRLIEENKTIAVERSRLADLMGTVQKMQNDIERSTESDRRRLETQIQTLENQSQDLRTQLSQERDTLRQITLQRDLEVQELRIKVDRTVGDLSKARESLVEAETSRKHLTERLEDLQKQMKTNEEKLAVYERRTTGDTSQETTNGLTEEQQMRVEIAELRATLKANEMDNAALSKHVEQFKEISQASEAALAQLMQTHEEYKSSAEEELRKLETQNKTLDGRLTSMQDEVKRLADKNSELQQTLESERTQFLQDRKTLEETIVEITENQMTARTDQTSREGEVREQMERVKAAEEKYSREIVAHAETMKVVDSLRKDLQEAQSSAREKTLTAEAAQAKLSSSEVSWKQQKDILAKEVSDLNARCKDLSAQNALLHQHLESVNSQASKIRQAADDHAALDNSADSDDSDGRLAELRSVVSYLRKEKEIVDLQLELSKQESARMKTQVDYLTQSLEETRIALSTEREQAAQAVQNSSQHTELMERITQMNILRESNATLRAESEAHARKARQLESTLAQLQAELGPLKEESKVVRAELEEKNKQMSRLEKENMQWKERNSQLLTKYDRIDPNDVQALRDEIEDLQIDIKKFEEEKAAREKEAEAQAKLLEDTATNLQQYKTKYEQLTQQFRQRLGQLNSQVTKANETISELKTQLASITAERDKLSVQSVSASSSDTDSLRTQLDTLRQEKDSVARSLAEEKEKSAKAIAQKDALLAKLREEREKLVAEKAALSATVAGGVGVPVGEPSDVVKRLETEKAELVNARDSALASAAQASDEAKNLRLQNEKFTARISDNEKRKAMENQRFTALVEKHKKEQEEAVASAIAKLKAELQTPANANDITARHAEELRSLEAKLNAKHAQELKDAVEKARKEATGSPDKVAEEQHLQDIVAATERGRLEMASKLKLKDNVLLKVQNNVKKLEWQIQTLRESGVAIPDPPASLTSTPLTKQPAAKPPAATGAPASTSQPAVVRTPLATGVSAPTTQSAASKPTMATGSLPAQPTPPVGAAAVAVRGARGGGRGLVRGALRGGITRGGAPGRVAVAQPPPTEIASDGSASGSGVSIMGAAGKRGREDSETPDSLAKRIKPAEGAAKPVALRRDRISTTTSNTPQ